MGRGGKIMPRLANMKKMPLPAKMGRRLDEQIGTNHTTDLKSAKYRLARLHTIDVRA